MSKEEFLRKYNCTQYKLKQHPQENAPERPEPVKNEMSELDVQFHAKQKNNFHKFTSN